MRHLHIDIETFSGISISLGVHAYVDTPAFRVLLLAYAFDDGDVGIVDIECGEEIPGEVMEALGDRKVRKIAHNAIFERTCLSRWLKMPMPADEWECTMAMARQRNIPASLKACGAALGLERQKMEEGLNLIMTFSVPTKTGRRIKPASRPEDWQVFKDYCVRDVDVERQIWHRMRDMLTTPEMERKVWILDQRINGRGVAFDRRLCENMVLYAEGLGIKLDKCDAMFPRELDGRLYGLYQYMGASQTGRWTSSDIQLQNMRRCETDEVERWRSKIRNRDVDEMEQDELREILPQLVRTVLIPGEGCRFLIMDYSAIEPRVLAWLTDEKWVVDIFKRDGKLYEETAARIFSKPVEEITPDERHAGKIANLALGYLGGTGALSQYREYFTDEEQMRDLVDRWREERPALAGFARLLWLAFWTGGDGTFDGTALRTFQREKDEMLVMLPSGRYLRYTGVVRGRNPSEHIRVNGVKGSKTVEKDIWKGSLLENVVSGIARDILAEAMVRLDNAGYRIVMHTHDEVVIELREWESVEDAERIFTTPPWWFKGMPLRCESKISEYYSK